ncbi:MAG: hypothetical protein GY952_15050 [Rhodobacteraceae bacterium]|nr:hypothetical protein [Paracoccaceae bacterium]
MLFEYFAGIDVSPLLQGGGGQSSSGSAEITEADEQAGRLVSATLADTEEI